MTQKQLNIAIRKIVSNPPIESVTRTFSCTVLNYIH